MLPAAAELQSHGVAIVGGGRLGRALTAALPAAGVSVRGPLGRGATCESEAIVLLCVPDREVNAAARLVAPGRLTGHCSGLLTLAALEPHERFSFHPLMVVPAGGRVVFAGAAAAVAGSSDRAQGVATALATTLGMTPVQVADEHRALYHAAATMASNYLVAVETAAEAMAARAGIARAMLAPLARAALESWAADGAGALTGPIVRGDVETVARQREAVARSAPDLLPFWDALTARTVQLARELYPTG